VAHTSERLVIEAIQVCLRAILGAATNSGLPFEKRLLLAAIFHCSTDVDHARAMRDLGDTVLVLVRGSIPQAHNHVIEVLVLESADFERPKIGATACLLVMILFSAWCHDGSCLQLF
jgi:hypothetical protein